MDRFWSKVEVGAPDECWPWTAATDDNGYGAFRFDGGRRLAHRVSFWLAHGRWPEPCARHTCDNPPCVNPAHLIEGTKAENFWDMVERGRGIPGAPRKLTLDQEASIRDEYARGGVLQRELAERYGVSVGLLCQTVNAR